METSVLKAGDKVDIRAMQQVQQQEVGGEPARVLKSAIYDVKSDGTLEIGMPTEGGKMILLSLGLRYEVVFYTKQGLYRAIGQVRERYKSDNLYMVNMELKTNLSKYQRREYYRLECVLDMTCFVVSPEEMEMEDEVEIIEYHKKEFPQDCPSKGTIVDISGGGIRFVSNVALEEKGRILIRTHLISDTVDQEFALIGTILQKRRLDSEFNKFEYRVQFCMKNNKVREKIIKYIFEEERKIRKNEKG